MNEFASDWGNSVILITASCLTLFLFIFLKSYKSLTRQRKSKFFHTVVLITVNFIIFFAVIFTLLFLPLRVAVYDDMIFLKQVKSGISIPYNEITEIRKYTQNDSKHTIRVFGSGGVFGYIGKFTNSQIGRIEMYATNPSNRILIRTIDKNKNYVISCKEPEIFIDKVKNNINKSNY